MGVGVQGDAHIGMAEAMLYHLCTDSCGDECGGIAMTKAMEIRIGKLVLFNEAAPFLGCGIRMVRLAIVFAEDIAQILEARGSI